MSTRDAPLVDRLTGRLPGGLSTMVALALASAGTTWISMFAWRGFTTSSALFLGPLFLLGLLVAGLGVALRVARLPALGVFAVQAVVGFVAGQSMVTGFALPTPAAMADLASRVSAALETSQEYAAPVPSSAPGVEPLLILGGLACLLLGDLLACSLRRVALAGLPLLTIYTIPVSLTGFGVSWWVFAAMAAGFALMLYLQESEHLSRWGRTLGRDTGDPAGFGVRTGDVRGSAAGIAGVATAAALVLPLLIPAFSVQLFSGGFGPGTGDGDLRLENPMTHLRRDHELVEDIPLLQVTTDNPSPSYLRIAVLNRLGDDAWSSGDRTVPAENRAQGPLPALRGVDASVPRATYDYQVEVADAFQSLWLPTAQNVSTISAPGDWRFDVETMDFLSRDDDLTTGGLDYGFTEIELDLSGPAMVQTDPSTITGVSAESTFVPGDLPDVVSDLAREVTADLPSRYQRAVALQNWFRETGGFTYSLDTPVGNGAQDLESFLTEGPDGRTGYCEQFASAMAVMARALGIPSRVAVGFLRPEAVSATVWEYSAHDMHAWPELYFPGSGWVRFEPTPAAGPDGTTPTTAPRYTTERLPAAPVPSAQPSAAQPSEDTPDRAPEDVRPDPSAADEADADGGAISPLGWGILIAVAVLALLGVLAFVPQVLRRMRRERRWGDADSEGATAAWDELRDTAEDLGVPWHQGLSPRATRNRLVEFFGPLLDDDTPERPVRGPAHAPQAVAALDRIVHELELLRYSRHTVTPDPRGLRFDTGLCISALEGGATRAARRRARWLPRSLWRRRPRTVVTRDPDQGAPGASATTGVVVDHVG